MARLRCTAPSNSSFNSLWPDGRGRGNDNERRGGSTAGAWTTLMRLLVDRRIGLPPGIAIVMSRTLHVGLCVRVVDFGTHWYRYITHLSQ